MKINKIIGIFLCVLFLQCEVALASSYVLDGYELFEAFNSLQETQIDIVNIYRQLTEEMLERGIQYDEQEKYIRLLAGDDVESPLTEDNRMDENLLYWAIRKNVTEEDFAAKANTFLNETMDIYKLLLQSSLGKHEISSPKDALELISKAINKGKFNVSNTPSALEVGQEWAVVPNAIINGEYISLSNSADVFWESENPEIASVYRGRLLGKSEGTTTINVYWYGKDKSTSFQVKVLGSTENVNEESCDSDKEIEEVINKHKETASAAGIKLCNLEELLISPKKLAETLSEMKLYDYSLGLAGVTVEVCSSTANYFFEEWYNLNNALASFKAETDSDKEILKIVISQMNQYDITVINEIGSILEQWTQMPVNYESSINTEQHNMRLDSVKEAYNQYKKCKDADFFKEINEQIDSESSISEPNGQDDTSEPEDFNGKEEGFFSQIGNFFKSIFDTIKNWFK